MKRLVGALVLLLALSAGCRDDAAPGGVDQQVDDVESTLDAVESEMAGD